MKFQEDKSKIFDVIVIGGGHAGIEAAYCAAKMDSSVLLITMSTEKIGHMPCNPALGGIGKGHIISEIATFGGLMPKIASKTYLQARMLNTSKGPAVQGLRLQIDKKKYSRLCFNYLKSVPNIKILEDSVEKLILQNGNFSGVETENTGLLKSKCAVITSGTFLDGLIHIGSEKYSAGRLGEKNTKKLSQNLKDLGIKMGRLKTGTPPRLLKSSLDFSKMEIQSPTQLDYLFEFYPQKVTQTLPCHITRTTEQTHEIIKKNAKFSPIYMGEIKGTPPRYCPSIEDKITRFPNKTSHQIFVEPESIDCEEIYPNGLSTSLPQNIQEKFIRSIPGFEKAVLKRPGYAIEYDFSEPNQLNHTLEMKHIDGLFLAGQINGTTGYEEAAGQGLIAGINASLKSKNKKSFSLNRNESYIGVMIDDLVSLGVDEPYRMFTSRAERRLLLRQDNAFFRLGNYSKKLELIDDKLYLNILDEQEKIENLVNKLEKSKNKNLEKLLNTGQTKKILELIRNFGKNKLSARSIVSTHAKLLYRPYLEREKREIEKNKIYRNLKIPAGIKYDRLPGLSIELQQKLKKHSPKDIAQASLIQGMTPAAISLLIFKIRSSNKIHT